MNGAGRRNCWVVAIGGNALAEPHDPGALGRQGERAAALASPLVDAIAQGTQLIIVHGNGPQVGARLIQSEAAHGQVPALPLHVLVAETQGQMGHYLALAISTEMERRAIRAPVVCVVTHVLVDPRAPEFANPDKPVGPTYPEDQARRLAGERDWDVREVASGGWRRVVPSPRPLQVIEQASINRLAGEGACVIAGGGGGVPVAWGEKGLYGIDAVVDKDYTAERIATAAGASHLVILTDVPGAALSFGKKGQKYLREITATEARAYLARGEFAPGSMAPKVEACVEFVEAGGGRAVIAAMDDAKVALLGDAGTEILPG